MNKLTPEIIGWAQQGAVPAALKIAAAMEESGLGAEIPPGSNNWFGIKGAGPATDTKEQTAGGVWYTIKAGFHMFKTPADGFAYYDWLISTGAPYAAAWRVWLASKQTNDDVETLTRSVAIKYATALAYAKALVSIEVADKLFPYDRKPGVAPAPAPTVKAAATPPLKVAAPQEIAKAQAQIGQLQAGALSNGVSHLDVWERVKAALAEVF
jgi:flagellum-specific peptidoglycan hydrolase FlgJ